MIKLRLLYYSFIYYLDEFFYTIIPVANRSSFLVSSSSLGSAIGIRVQIGRLKYNSEFVYGEEG